MAKSRAKARETEEENERECFVIMPISDPDGYEPGHFKHVYDDLFRPACKAAGFRAVRADDIRETNLIHLDILQKIVESPMAICDLSSRNPNVLFELGIRQAFDKPVLLVEEVGTPRIFDIAPLRATPYRRQRVYHEVIEDQDKIADALRATEAAAKGGRSVNSIVQLLSLGPASLKDIGDAAENPMLQIVRAEIAALRQEFRQGLPAKLERQTVQLTDRGERDRLKSFKFVNDNLMHLEGAVLKGTLPVDVQEAAEDLDELAQRLLETEHPPSFARAVHQMRARIAALRMAAKEPEAEPQQVKP